MKKRHIASIILICSMCLCVYDCRRHTDLHLYSDRKLIDEVTLNREKEWSYYYPKGTYPLSFRILKSGEYVDARVDLSAGECYVILSPEPPYVAIDGGKVLSAKLRK